ncbi:hypothetical protein B5X24_HaOG210146 [Helicoverpa armigera]|uniref:UBC core domain-containing protein n=1 Tax=Helicoverpa armigera TaxID=29058 RepID=A0A2W1BDT6_HELAM|nr:hypothetical protein B5X24_HaOG210146 [Helicoverpa armigera]
MLKLVNMNMFPQPWKRRLQKELMSLMKEPPPGVTVDGDQASQNLTLWTVHMEGVPGTLYEGEKFVLQFKFTNKYPFDSPEAVLDKIKVASNQIREITYLNRFLLRDLHTKAADAAGTARRPNPPALFCTIMPPACTGFGV